LVEVERVWVLDTSAIVDFKSLIALSDQWDAFKGLEERVIAGEIAMPRQVLNGGAELTHPDLPGTWATGIRGQLQHPLDVHFDQIQRVMAEAGEVTDPNKTTEDADPYVVALALQLREAGLDAIVVTSAAVDRLPLKIAMTTACNRLGVPHASPRDFLIAAGVKVKPMGTESA
jgi:hypothetical protein